MSRNNEVSEPAFALTLNPINSEAAVNFVVGALNDGGNPDLSLLTDVARRMISVSPADARGYSLLGAIDERSGDEERALANYQIALRHSKSELQALLRTAQASLDQGDTAGALEKIDLLLRRWPAYWDQVQPFLQAVASSPDTAVLLADKLNEMPPWRSRAIAALAKDPASLGTIRSVVAASPEALRTGAAWVAERETVVASLVSNKAYNEAYELFLSTLTEDEAAVAGYVYDGGFERPLGRSFFGWRAQKPGATEVRLGRQADTGLAGLRVRFLDSPARPGIVTQNLTVPFGNYRLTVEVTAAGLLAPKDLFWTIRCAQGQELTTVNVPPGTYPATRLHAEFSVPASGCPLQVLSLDTEVRTESWRDRYQGEVRFSNLDLTRL